MAGAGPVLAGSSLAPTRGGRLDRATTLSTYGWLAFGAVGLLVLGAYYLLASARVQDLLYDLYGLAAAGAILVGVRAYRPVRRDAWLALALGVALEAAGDLTLSFLASAEGAEPFPSLADALYIAGYAALAVGLVRLVAHGRRPRDQAAWIDALIIAGAATIVGWTLVFAQYLSDPTLSLPGVVVSVAYPFMDIVLLAVVAHLLIVSGRGQLSLALLALGFLANLLADTWYIFLSLDGTYEVGHLVDAGWLIGYLAIGAAALHPSMGRAGDPPEASRIAGGGLSRRRLALVACGALVTPGAAFAAMVRGTALDVPSVLVGSGFIYLLVVYRVVLGMRQQRELTEERSRLAQAIEQAPDMIWLTDASGAVRYANPAFTRTSGLATAELVGRWLGDVLHAGVQAPEVMPAIAAALARGDPWAGLVVVPRGDGSSGLQVDLSTSPIRDSSGRVTGWTHVARDVTHERSMESDLSLGASVRAALEIDAARRCRRDLRRRGRAIGLRRDRDAARHRHGGHRVVRKRRRRRHAGRARPP